MYIITSDNIQADPAIGGNYTITLPLNGQNISIALTPDDVAIETTIVLANKILSNFQFYEKNARQKIIADFLADYNENARDKTKGEPEMDEKKFDANLSLAHIWFLSADGIEFFYSENGLFGHHSLIAQSFDGENFDSTTMHG
jgi:hypothetical protein